MTTETNPTAVIEINGVSKSFGSLKAVDGVSLSIGRGFCFSLLGPNGAGKTTLSRMIGGVLPRNSGSMRVLGKDPWVDQTEVKFRLGVVMQDDALDEELDVRRNLEIYGRYFGLKGAAFRAKVGQLLSFVDLAGREKTHIQALSGGMKRRLVFARALLNDPDVLLLDEPTTGLDPQVRQLIWAMLRKLMAKGMTILLTTHYMSEASHLADQVAVMDKGRLIADGSPDELVQTHLPPWVLEFDTLNDPDVGSRIGKQNNFDQHGDRGYVFHDEEGLLRNRISELGLETALIRRTNLEDVFLKLTGRGLNE